MELWEPPKPKSPRLQHLHCPHCKVDPRRLRWHFPPSNNDNCHCQDVHFQRVPRGWTPISEGHSRGNLLQHPHRVPGLGPRGCVGRGTSEEIQENRDGDGLPPPRQHSVQSGAPWSALVHRSVNCLQSVDGENKFILFQWAKSMPDITSWRDLSGHFLKKMYPTTKQMKFSWRSLWRPACAAYWSLASTSSTTEW